MDADATASSWHRPDTETIPDSRQANENPDDYASVDDCQAARKLELP
jgi:hypothetical protein